ncbi:MAG: lipopolysaccharide heptosyltransferase II [Nitrospirales bacterium]
MTQPQRILVLHTAFLGDIILTLPMVQVLKRNLPGSFISFLAIPVSAAVVRNHPSISQVIEFDKKGKDSGVSGLLRCAAMLRKENYDTAIVPHRSLRSALLPVFARIPERIGFTTSAGKFLLTKRVPYVMNRHEILRNLDLLGPLGIKGSMELPELYPSATDAETVDGMIGASLPHLSSGPGLVAIAPGSIWETKRWPGEKFAELARLLTAAGYVVALIGSKEDSALAEKIAQSEEPGRVLNAAGKLSMLQSAELIRRSGVLVSNDSAPMHAGVAMGTPVVALFGATVPEFGFGPLGPRDRIHQTQGLVCRPCSIHGGRKCPIGTFECMHRITPEQVFQTVIELMNPPRSIGKAH